MSAPGPRIPAKTLKPWSLAGRVSEAVGDLDRGTPLEIWF